MGCVNSSCNLPPLSTLVFDLDGVVWRGSLPVPGATDAIEALRAAGLGIYFATNNSTRPPRDVAQKLRAQGIAAAPEDVVTSSTATGLYLAAQVKAGKLPAGFTVFPVGEEGLFEALAEIGAQIASPDAPGVDCVVSGLERAFNYQRLHLAQHYIRQGALFINTNGDATFPMETHLAPGAGSLAAAIATAAGQLPVVIGKPGPLMMELLMERLGIGREVTALIGDRLDTDIACAHRSGVRAIHVATGVTSTEEARAAQGELRPHDFFSDLTALAEAILG
jgi:4-nitrophenyl phosphatase